MTRLVHAGSAVVDYVYNLDVLPLPGHEKIASSHARVAGGGFNMMVAARRSGMPVAFAGRHGTGPDGDFLREAFRRESIETLLPADGGLDSGNCVVIVTADAERTFVSWPGCESMLAPEDMAPVQVRAGDWVFSSGYTLSYPASRETLADWIDALPPATPLVFDPAPVVAEIPRDLLARVLARTTWLSCNTAEAEIIAGKGDQIANLDALLRTHCVAAEGVVIRASAEGAFLGLRDGTVETVAGFKVAAVDTNGAGDTHIGAFTAALARGEAPAHAVRYANAAAAISVTRHGGSSAPGEEEIRNFMNEYRHRQPGSMEGTSPAA